MVDYGVTITAGITPWQIFQQGEDGTARIHVSGKYRCVHLSQEVPIVFDYVEGRNVKILSRVALESTGESVIPWTPCRVIDGETWEITFDHVPAGGLYQLETYMEYEGWDGLSVTRGDMIHNFGVGDIFVIAGQSNAGGRAKGPVEDEPELGVSVLRTSAKWDLATHPLGETTESVHVGHYENHNPGQCPWLHFAKILKHTLGYPIGLVPCSYGGSPLRWWNPEENGALFTNMMEMLADYDIHPKAMLWYQGEAEGFENSAETYLSRFTAFVGHVRQALHQPDLPFLTVQVNRCTQESNETLDRQWGMVREAQRQAWHTIPHVTVVPSTDVALYDFIHNSAQGNLVIGERCARAALAEIYHQKIEWEAPEPEKVTLESPDTVTVRFSRIRNWLNPYEVPAAQLPFNAQDDTGLLDVKSYETLPDGLKITFDRPLGENPRLHGIWRMNPGLVPWDCMRMPLLSFYGVPIEKPQ